MNAIINWIALNNTLMIKIGSSAVILLIVVYVFRFFFVPQVKQISDSADLSDSDDISVEKVDFVKDGAVAISSEDVTKLQAEISTLKYKLKEAEIEKVKLASQSTAAPENSSNSSPTSAAAGLEMVAEANPQVAAVQTELEEKIKVLEARLSEYEIIAEDIAEISKLRQENEELKAKVADGGTSKEVSEVDLAQFLPSEDPVFDEAVPEATSEAVVESQLLEEYAASKTVSDDSSRVVITSDVDISVEEKNSLNDFEQFKKMKKG